jgi:hypothetical protein
MVPPPCTAGDHDHEDARLVHPLSRLEQQALRRPEMLGVEATSPNGRYAH